MIAIKWFIFDSCHRIMVSERASKQVERKIQNEMNRFYFTCIFEFYSANDKEKVI